MKNHAYRSKAYLFSPHMDYPLRRELVEKKRKRIMGKTAPLQRRLNDVNQKNQLLPVK